MTWIKVEDALPDLGKNVLVIAINKVFGTFELGERYFAIDRLVQWNDNEKLTFRTDRLYGKVTHWMELPKMPEEENIK